MREGGGPRPERRALLLGLLTAPVLLTGCDVVLEADAPAVPLVPTREPLPGEDLLTALTRACADLADQAAVTPGRVAAALVPAHRRQHQVLRTTLVRLGVPVAVVDGAPSDDASAAPTATGGPSPSPSASRAAVAALGEAEGTAASGVLAFTGVDEDLRDPVLSLHAQRFAAAVLLTRRAPVVAGDPIASDVVEELVQRTRGARYLLQVVAARSTGRARRRGETTLAALDRLLADQVAGGSDPDEPFGVPLPFPVRTPQDATRLAREALAGLRGAYGPRLAALREDHGDDGWAAATRWLGTVEAECHRWGLPVEPFPALDG